MIMRRFRLLAASLLVTLCTGFSSCGDDEFVGHPIRVEGWTEEYLANYGIVPNAYEFFHCQYTRDWNFVALGLLSDQHLWMGVFDTLTYRQIYEIRDEEITEKKISKYVGYGEYEDLYLSEILPSGLAPTHGTGDAASVDVAVHRAAVAAERYLTERDGADIDTRGVDDQIARAAGERGDGGEHRVRELVELAADVADIGGEGRAGVFDVVGDHRELTVRRGDRADDHVDVRHGDDVGDVKILIEADVDMGLSSVTVANMQPNMRCLTGSDRMEPLARSRAMI